MPEPYYPCEKFTVSKSTTIRLFRSIVLYTRRVPPARNPHFHKSTGVPRHHRREDPPIESFIILPSPRTISRAYPRSLNDVTMRRSMGIIHERQRSITPPAALSSLSLRSYMERALRLKSCAPYSQKRYGATTVVALLRAVIRMYDIIVRCWTSHDING